MSGSERTGNHRYAIAFQHPKLLHRTLNERQHQLIERDRLPDEVQMELCHGFGALEMSHGIVSLLIVYPDRSGALMPNPVLVLV